MAYKMLKVNIKKLQVALINQGISLTELATLSGLSTETIYRMFNQSRASVKTLGKIAKALDIDIERVLEDVS